jgi:hypothetical protein
MIRRELFAGQIARTPTAFVRDVPSSFFNHDGLFRVPDPLGGMSRHRTGD